MAIKNLYQLDDKRITSNSIAHQKENGDYENLKSYLNNINSIICVGTASGNISYTISKSWTNYNIPVTEIIKNNKSNLTLRDGKLVNNTVKTLIVSISASILVSHTTNNTDKEFAIAKNGTNDISAYGIAPSNMFSSVSISNYIMELAPGDIISLNMRFGATGTAKVSSEGSYITIREYNS